MKIFVYSYREFDEAVHFQNFSRQLGIEIETTPKPPTLETAHLAEGYEYISIITTKVDAALLEKFHAMGIKMISTRTIGYDHIDLGKAIELGIRVSNATYPPSSVADYTVLLILMMIRRMKQIMNRAAVQDFTLPGIQGGEMPDYTIGVVGTGRIGRTVLKNLSGFGSRLLAYDLNPNGEAEKYADYCSFEQLLEQSDIITLHMPGGDGTYHIMNEDTIGKMKTGAVLVNTARGSLIDTGAMIRALESQKLGGAALDVVENEFGLYYGDRKSDVIVNRDLAVLKSFPNVIVTPHMAWYTDGAVREMVYSSLKSCCLCAAGEKNPWEVI